MASVLQWDRLVRLSEPCFRVPAFYRNAAKICAAITLLPVIPMAGVEPWLESAYRQPLLTRDQEHHIFRRMHFHRYNVHKLAKERRAYRRAYRRADKHLEAGQADRSVLCSANLRIIADFLRQNRPDDPDQWLSTAQLTLLQSVDTFDYRRSNRLSTYLWPKLFRRAEQYRKDAKPWASISDYDEPAAVEQHANGFAASKTVMLLLSRLSAKERNVIKSIHGIGGPPERAREIAKRLGISRQCVETTVLRSLAKMRCN